MSKVCHRRGQPTRGRTASTTTVMLSAEGVRKGGGTTKVRPRSGSARPAAERGSSAGPTPLRKSGENASNVHNVSCTAAATACQEPKPASQHVPSKIRNENVPMHDSSNNSIPEPPNPALSEGHYTNRFGHVQPIIIDLTQTPIPTSISSNVASAPNNNNGQQLKTNSCETSESNTNTAAPRQDHPKINEICRKHLRSECPWGNRCIRLHTRRGVSRVRPKIDEVCINFTNGRCSWGEMCDRIHQSPQDAKPNDSNILPELNSPSATDLTNEEESCSNAGLQISTPTVNCNSIATETMNAEESQAENFSNTLHTETKKTNESGDLQRTRRVCRNFLVHLCRQGRRCHRWHPSAADLPQALAREEVRPKQDVICQQFLNGRCNWGTICNLIHPVGTQLDGSTVDASNGNQTILASSTDSAIVDPKILISVPADVKDDEVAAEIRSAEQPLLASPSSEPCPETEGPLSHDSRRPPRPKEICRSYLIDRCERDPYCRRFHPPEAERLQLLEAERSRPKLSQLCQQFLRGRCRWGVLCYYTHSRPNDATLDESIISSKMPSLQNVEETICPLTATNPKLESIPITTPETNHPYYASEEQRHNGDGCHLLSPPSASSSLVATPRQDALTEEIHTLNSPNSTPEADGDGLMHKSKAGRTTKLRRVCRRHLNGIKHNIEFCRYFHLPLDQQQNSSANEQVDEAIPVYDHEEPSDSDSDSDSDTSSVEHGSFSRLLVDASCTNDKPLVNMPKTDRFSKRVGRRRKKKKDSEKVYSSTPPTTTEELTAVRSDKLSVDAEAPVSNEVVNLPSLQRHSSISTGSGDGHNYSIGQANGGSVTEGTRPFHNNLAFCADSFESISTSSPHTTCETIARPITPPSEVYSDWLRDENWKSPHINQGHKHSQVNKQRERDSTKIQTTVPSQVHSEQDKYFSSRHNVLSPSAPSLSGPVPPRMPPPYMTVTVLEHTKVNLGPGFEVQDVTTGFESRWVILGNIPSDVTEKTIRRTLKVFGQVDDLRMPATSSASSVNIKALFSSAAEAIQAAGALNGAQLFSRTISARLPLNNTTRGNGTLKDCSVRIEWDVPGRIGYAGYPSQVEAEAAVSAADGFTLRDSCITANIYEGLPALGAVNVRFAGLPPTANAQDLAQFGAPEEVMLERPNYMSIGIAAKAIQGLLSQAGEVLSFDLPPPPYRDRIVRAWAHFASPTLAQTASALLNGRRPYFIGKGKLSARHVQALSYTLPEDVYNKLASDITGLRHSFWQQGRGAVLSVVDRRAYRQHDSTLPVFIKLSGEDLGALGHLKAEFEKLLHGEILMQDGKVIWDGFLERSAGSAFLHEVERAHPGVSIQKSIARRTVTLFGPISKRRSVRRVILDKINRIRAQQTWEIPLAGRLIGLFISAELMALQQSLGQENVILNLLRYTLTIRGTDEAYEAAQRAVHQVQKRHPEGRREDIAECPVCFNQVVSPITLQCGHSWCKSCLSNYFTAAIDNKIFPLRCLGAEATCSQPIPVAIARDILCANEFDAVVNASFLTYIYARPDEFHYCPTPDCDQIYRSAPPETILQCPSCLTRICPSCHVEAHDGLTCAVRDVDGEKLFKEWMDAHDAKNCPGCKAVIERTEGCNHMTCSRCQTHICWVCMETFPKGEGIYDHMRMAHGGIGI